MLMTKTGGTCRETCRNFHLKMQNNLTTVIKITHSTCNFEVLFTNGGLGWISPESEFWNIIVHKVVFSVRRNLDLPTLIDICVKDWTMQWKKHTFKYLNMRNSLLFVILSCETGKKAGNKVFQKKFIFCNSYCNILLKYYISNNSNVLYSVLQQLYWLQVSYTLFPDR